MTFLVPAFLALVAVSVVSWCKSTRTHRNKSCFADPCEVDGCKVCPDARVCLECGNNLKRTDDNECETSSDPTPIILGKPIMT